MIDTNDGITITKLCDRISEIVLEAFLDLADEDANDSKRYSDYRSIIFRTVHWTASRESGQLSSSSSHDINHIRRTPVPIAPPIAKSTNATTTTTGNKQTWDPSGKAWNIEIRSCSALFERYAEREGDDTAGMETSRVFTLTSTWGVTRHFSSAASLATTLLPAIETTCFIEGLATHVRRRHATSGVLCLVTPHRASQLEYEWGLHPCPVCPIWCRGVQGIWWHLQQVHGSDHGMAIEQSYQFTSEGKERALVLYHPPRLTTSRSNHNQIIEADEDSNNAYNRNNQTTSLFAIAHTSRKTLAKSSTMPSTVHLPALGIADDAWAQVKRGDLENLKASIASQAIDPLTDTDRNGATLLLWAAGGGFLPIVQYLVEVCGADPHYAQTGHRSFRGRTALHWACRHGHVPIVRYLLSECHVNLCATTQDGTTALHWAAWQGHVDVIDELLKAPTDVRIITTTTNTTIASPLQPDPSNLLHHCNVYGCNAVLWMAQGCGTVSVLQYLMGRGCHIRQLNRSGHGILHKAAQRGRHELCQWLIENLFHGHTTSVTGGGKEGSNLDVFHQVICPDNEGYLPSDLAGMEGYENLAGYLADQEQDLAREQWNSTIGSTEIERMVTPPTWIHNAPVPSPSRIWEPWAGVARLRYAAQV